MAIRILLIDDEQDFLDLMTSWLEFKGFNVATARDGIEGLDRLQGGEYDLILLDLMMPRLDGFGFCRQVREADQYKDIPILILTAARHANGLRQPQSIGADALLEKLAGHDEIYAVMQQLLAARKDATAQSDSNGTLH